MIMTNGKKVYNQIKLKADALYVTCDYLMRYITGFAPENGAVLVDKNGVTLFTDSRYIEAAEKLFVGTEVTPVLWGKRTPADILKDYKIVAISFNETKHSSYLALEKIGVKLVEADTTLFPLMETKTIGNWKISKRLVKLLKKAFWQHCQILKRV